MRRLLIAFCVCWPGSAPAQQVLVVDNATCRQLTRHVPAPDVAYRPGVDVNGRAVAPADLPADSDLNLPRDIPIDLRIPVQSILGAASPRLTELADIRPGRLVVQADGQVLFEGRVVGDDARDRLVALCRGR